MKKIVILVIVVISLISASITAFASSVEITDNVNLSKNHTTGSFIISVDSQNAFAGAEFAALCGEDISITDVSYSVNGGKAGPTVAHGYVFFSFFSGSNDFSGKVTATVHFAYSGDKNTAIVIESVKVYTKNGAAVDTDKKIMNKTVEIKKEGATNPIDPPKPPENASSSSSNIGGGNTTSSTNGSVGGNNNSSAGTKSEQNSSSNNSNANSGSGNSRSSNESPTAADENKENSNFPVIILSVFLGASLIANGTLGALYFQSKKR